MLNILKMFEAIAHSNFMKMVSIENKNELEICVLTLCIIVFDSIFLHF